jgi:Spy/CpxP family protein refolding chaperone
MRWVSIGSVGLGSLGAGSCVSPISVYTGNHKPTKGKIMATQITLTDKQVQALFFAFREAESVYLEDHDYMYKAIDQVVAKLKKAGWE